ncbi:hypothetical protein D3C79_525420 [compost metagenome]
MRAVRQRTHLIRHHRKAAPGLARTGGLDGGIERQQVGLLGHRANHLQHLADVPHLPDQLLQMRAAGLDLPSHGLGAVDVVADLPAALRCQLVGFAGGLRGGDGIARNLLHGRGHFGDGGGGLLQLLALLAQVVGTFLGDGIQRRGGCVQLPGTAADLPQGVALALLHAFKFMEQLADLVTALPLHRHAQVATGNALEVPASFAQRVQHALGNKGPAQRRQQQRHAQQPQAQQLRARQAPVGFQHDLLTALTQCADQLLAQRLQPAHGVAGVGVDLEILLERTLTGCLTLPGDRLGILAIGGLQRGCQCVQRRLAGVFDKLVHQLLALVVQLDRQRHALVGAFLMTTQLLDEARGHIGTGANRHQQRIVQPVRLVRGLVQFGDLLVTAHRRPPGTDGGKQQGHAEQR